MKFAMKWMQGSVTNLQLDKQHTIPEPGRSVGKEDCEDDGKLSECLPSASIIDFLKTIR